MDKNGKVAVSLEKAKAQSILRSVSYSQGFHFFTAIGEYTGETATDLFTFYEGLKAIDDKSLSFHFQRHDFQNWVKNTLGDPELAKRIEETTPQQPLLNALKKNLINIVNTRLKELHTLANDP